ncbi:hypothetical protein CEXT_555071 [Caerostris extrusa]|uniref:Uncharacterized protein n=1 Tax=Caerostris extrusa TaxID=172846 RepID=A0AAV4XSA3_CAEEX|nr:hypothetical protein CEXT_555071 [Caerostris extrusa]
MTVEQRTNQNLRRATSSTKALSRFMVLKKFSDIFRTVPASPDTLVTKFCSASVKWLPQIGVHVIPDTSAKVCRGTHPLKTSLYFEWSWKHHIEIPAVSLITGRYCRLI